MSMYAPQVMTGMEAEITQKLRGKGVDARCPQERRMIRRGGKWQEQLLHAVPQLHLRQHAGCVPRLLCGAP